MKKKKISIESTKPISSIADVERIVDAFVERGGYKIRGRFFDHLEDYLRLRTPTYLTD